MKYTVLLVLALILAGCARTAADASSLQSELYHHHQSFTEMVFTPSSRLFNETTLEGLEYRATHIVKGRMGNDARISLGFSDHTPPRLRLGSNLVSLEILEVFYGDIEKGDTILLVEPYYIVPFDILEENHFDLTGVDRSAYGVFFTVVDYLPSIPYREYIFFLGPQFSDEVREEIQGGFPVAHGERSRFLIPVDTRVRALDLSSHELSVGPYAELDVYMSLWREVMDAYVY